MSRTILAVSSLAVALGFVVLTACSSGDGSFRGRPDAGFGSGNGRTPGFATDGGLGDGAATDADSDARGATAFFLDWSIEDVGLPLNDTVPCTEAGVTSLAVTATNTATGAVTNFSFGCATQSGVQIPLPPGPYRLAMRLLRPDAVEVSAIEFPFSLGDLGVTDLGGVVFEIQSFSLSWTLTRTAAPMVPVTCASVGASQVELVATTAGLAPFVFRFACNEGNALTQAVPDATYALQYRLLDASGNALSQLSNANYTTPMGAPAKLPAVTFTVN